MGKLKAYVKEHKARPFQPRPKGSKLRVFSDCAGISAEALTLLGLKQFFTIVGGSEIDEVKRCLIGVVHETCRTSCKSESFELRQTACCFGSSKAASAMKKCLTQLIQAAV